MLLRLTRPIRWLKRELLRWQEAGILSAEQAGRILSLYAEQPLATESSCSFSVGFS